MRTVREEHFLTIREIAEEYERNGHEVRAALLNAFWMGRFEPFVRLGPSKYPLITRRSMLEAWHDLGDHPGLCFATSAEEASGKLPDDSFIVDTRTLIELPSQPADWKPNDLRVAYSQLATLSISDISGPAYAGLMCQFLGAYELLAVCYDQGEPPPPFWVHWDTTRRISERKKTEFFNRQAEKANWLEQRLHDVAASDVRREDVFAEARSDHGLSEGLFDKLWKAFAPDQLKRGGAARALKIANHELIL
jgi:hypothetical protein